MTPEAGNHDIGIGLLEQARQMEEARAYLDQVQSYVVDRMGTIRASYEGDQVLVSGFSNRKFRQNLPNK